MPRYSQARFIYRAWFTRPRRWEHQRDFESLLQSGLFEVLFPPTELVREALDRITRDDCRRLDLQTKKELYAIMLRTKRLIDNGRLNLFREPPEALLFALQVETRRILHCGINNLNNQRSRSRSQSRSQSRGHRAGPSTSTSSLVTEDQDTEPVMVTFFCNVTIVEHTD